MTIDRNTDIDLEIDFNIARLLMSGENEEL